MQLKHIELNQLKSANINVRKRGGKNTDDLVPSIRSLGIIQPLLVRPNCSGYEVVAGQRRLNALQEIVKEQSVEPVPCIVMKKGDDAKALEASLAENIARLPMDEIDQFKAFSALIKKGNTIEEIASQFAISERLIKQRLAIAGLISPIITAFRKDKISATTLRILTMATKRQQREWYDLFKTGDNDAPQGYSLKCWLFGGSDINVENAIFNIEKYEGAIITDLFDDDKYFSDANLFWQHQSKAVAKLKQDYMQAGWCDVVILDIGEYFPSYEYVDTTKKEGGKVYISLSHSGEVTCFEGQLSRKEIKAKNRAEDKTNNPAEKPELTKPLRNYLDLHRHSAVRTELLGHSGVAMRLAIAQIIAGSGLWTVHAEPQKASNENITASLSDNNAEQAFSKQRKLVSNLLDIDVSDDGTVVPRKHDYELSHDVGAIFCSLLELDDDSVNSLFSFVVAETLPSGSELVDIVGSHLNVDIGKYWTRDDAFFELIRDKQTVNAILNEVAGSSVADANITSTAKVQKQKIKNRLDAEKTNSAEWLPVYFKFPMEYYRDNNSKNNA